MPANYEEQVLLVDAARKIFAEQCDKDVVNAAEAGQWPEKLWKVVRDLGFLSAAVPERQGGSAMELAQVLPIIRVAGSYAAPIPLGETIIAAWLLAQAGLAVPQGALSFGPVDRSSKITLLKTSSGWQLDGRLRHIPWGGHVEGIALLIESDERLMVVSANPKQASHVHTTNLAGEPRCHIAFTQLHLSDNDVKPAPTGVCNNSLYLYGALLRSQQIAGAMTTIRDLSVQYTGERIAFGKPLNRLQAVQQNLAIIAGQTAAANVAADMALDALALNNNDCDIAAITTAIALAKIRSNQAVDVAARLAHQAHGAIGFTHEHKLHQATRRLWAWRDEFGSEAYWSELIGKQIIEAGSEKLWSLVTQAAQL
jgi:alkylation response protein AidB-like acyl-CoA dehydrogenase